MDYLQQSLEGLSSGMGEYEVANSLANENVITTLNTMLSEVRGEACEHACNGCLSGPLIIM